MKRMKNRWAVILVIMMVISTLSFASAEDETAVFSIPVEETVLEREDVELPRDDKESLDEFGVEQDEVELEAVDYADYSDETAIDESTEGVESVEDISVYSEYQKVESVSQFGMMAAGASATLQRPKDVDNGYWVNAYRKYMDNTSKYKGYAVLADFDLDGIPELLALSDIWGHIGVSGCLVKYTGDQYIVYEDELILHGFQNKFYLALDNGNYVWYLTNFYASTGLYNSFVGKLNFSGSMKMSYKIWFELYGNMDEGTEEYNIWSRNVSRNEYDQEEAKWERMTKLLAFDPADYAYPSKWSNAVNQYSVTIGSGSDTGVADEAPPEEPSDYSSTTQISVLSKNVKAKVNAGSTYQINLGGKKGEKYKSSKKKVATVDSNGLITAKSKGKARITFKVGGKKRTLTLNVIDPTIPTSVSLNMTGTISVKQGDTVTLTATLPSGTHSGIKWKSNRKSVATVKNGVVTFKKKGSVTITATTTRGKKKAKVKFKVAKYDAKKDLSNYGWRTVQGVSSGNKLTFRKTHTGGYMSNHRFANGEKIFVNLTWREGGDAIAYDNGTYGYVQAKYIAW